MSYFEKLIELNVPVSAAYNQWPQFEEFPTFMQGVREVKQLDDKRLHWRVEIAGQEREWDAEITEQRPDQLIAWRSITGAKHAGSVRFDKLDNSRCRLIVSMDYHPEGFIENIGDTLGLVEQRVQDNLEWFKAFIEHAGGRQKRGEGNSTRHDKDRRAGHHAGRGLRPLLLLTGLASFRTHMGVAFTPSRHRDCDILGCHNPYQGWEADGLRTRDLARRGGASGRAGA